MGFSNLNDGEMICTARTGMIEPHTEDLGVASPCKVCRAPASAKFPHPSKCHYPWK